MRKKLNDFNKIFLKVLRKNQSLLDSEQKIYRSLKLKLLTNKNEKA